MTAEQDIIQNENDAPENPIKGKRNNRLELPKTNQKTSILSDKLVAEQKIHISASEVPLRRNRAPLTEHKSVTNTCTSVDEEVGRLDPNDERKKSLKEETVSELDSNNRESPDSKQSDSMDDNLFHALPPAPVSSTNTSTGIFNENNPNLTMPVGSCDMFSRLLSSGQPSKQKKRKPGLSNHGNGNTKKKAFGDATNRLGISSSPIRPPKTPPGQKQAWNAMKSQTMGGRIRVQDIRHRPGTKGSCELGMGLFQERVNTGSCGRTLFSGPMRHRPDMSLGSTCLLSSNHVATSEPIDGADSHSQKTSSSTRPIQWGFSSSSRPNFSLSNLSSLQSTDQADKDGVELAERTTEKTREKSEVLDLPPGIYSYDLSQKDDNQSLWKCWIRDDNESLGSIQSSESIGVAISVDKKNAWILRPSDLDSPCLEQLVFSPPLKENDTLVDAVCGAQFIAIMTEKGLVYLYGCFESPGGSENIQLNSELNTAVLLKKFRFRVHAMSAGPNTLFLITKRYHTVYWIGYPFTSFPSVDVSTTPPDSDDEATTQNNKNVGSAPSLDTNSPLPLSQAKRIQDRRNRLTPKQLAIHETEGVSMRDGSRAQVKAVKTWAGKDRVFFIDVQNRLFAMGNNDRGQCGIEGPRYLSTPTLIPWFDSKLTMPPEDMTCSSHYTAFLDPPTDDLFHQRSIFMMGHNDIESEKLQSSLSGKSISSSQHKEEENDVDDDHDARSDTTLPVDDISSLNNPMRDYRFLTEMKPTDCTKSICCSGDNLLYLNVINEVYRVPVKQYLSVDRYNKQMMQSTLGSKEKDLKHGDPLSIKATQPGLLKKFDLRLLQFKTIWKGQQAYFSQLRPTVLFTSGTHVFCLFHKFRMQRAVMVNGELKMMDVSDQ